jgi:hypothetical protein
MRLEYGGRMRSVSDGIVAARGDEKMIREAISVLEKYAL